MELYAEAGGVFLRPLPARRSALCLAARLQHRGDAARRPREPGRAGGEGRRGRRQGQARGAGTTGTTAGSRFNMVAREMEDIVERGYVIVGSPKEVDRAARARGHDAQRRPPHAAAAVRQHVEGADQVQHQAVRREGDAEAVEAVPRVGGQVVAEADGEVDTRRAAGLPARQRSPPRNSRLPSTSRSTGERTLERAARPRRSTSTAIPAASGGRAAARRSAFSRASAACRAGCRFSIAWRRNAR